MNTSTLSFKSAVMSHPFSKMQQQEQPGNLEHMPTAAAIEAGLSEDRNGVHQRDPSSSRVRKFLLPTQIRCATRFGCGD